MNVLAHPSLQLPPQEPSRVLSNHPLTLRAKKEEVPPSCGGLLSLIGPGHPETTEPRDSLTPVVGATGQRARGPRIPRGHRFLCPHFSAGRAEVGEAGFDSVPFRPHFSGSQGLVVGMWSLGENPELALEV